MSDADLKLVIQTVIRKLMESVMHKVIIADPFDPTKLAAEKPLYSALVPQEILKGSHFERRFVTPFGNIWEDLAVAAAQHALGDAATQFHIHGQIRKGRSDRITEVLLALEHKVKGKKIRPDWGKELQYILDGQGEKIAVTVVCDVFARNVTTGHRMAFELKAPLPNKDQSKVSKEKLFKLFCMEPRQVDEAFFALPYNPYGKRENYSWSFPMTWFDMRRDPVVLIGEEFWEKIGGTGTYHSFIDAINEIGQEYRDRIAKDYLGIVSKEPPPLINGS